MRGGRVEGQEEKEGAGAGIRARKEADGAKNGTTEKGWNH